MKKFVTGLMLYVFTVVCLSVPAQAQSKNPAFQQSQNLVGTVGPTVFPIMSQASLNVTSHTLTWVASGTVSTCTIVMQSSTTYGGSYTTLTGSAAQTCTSSGSYTVNNVSVNFLRVNVTALSGSGNVTFTYTGNYQGSGGGSTNLVAVDCGTVVACVGTSITANLKIVVGSAALTSASPSTATITGLPFTSSTSYHCTTENQTTRTNIPSVLTAGYVSGASFVITAPNTLTDVIDYICIGS